MGKVRDNFVKVAEHKGVEKAFDHFFYWVRENNTPEDLETFSPVPGSLKTDQNIGFRRRKQWVNYMQLGSVQVDMNT